MMKNFGSSIYVYEFYEFVILFMYKNAKEVRERHNTQHQTPQNSVWTRPSEGYLKCNVDAYPFRDRATKWVLVYVFGTTKASSY
jgi:hypothetical protein